MLSVYCKDWEPTIYKWFHKNVLLLMNGFVFGVWGAVHPKQKLVPTFWAGPMIKGVSINIISSSSMVLRASNSINLIQLVKVVLLLCRHWIGLLRERPRKSPCCVHVKKPSDNLLYKLFYSILDQTISH